MKRHHQVFRRKGFGLRLVPLVLVLLLLGLGRGGNVLGSSLSAHRGFDAEAHAHNCKCGMRCRRASCCCEPKEPRKSARPADAKAPVAESASGGAEGPCFAAAPCGDLAVPTGVHGGVSKIAALILCLRKPEVGGGRLLAVPLPLCPPSRLASRLERPPKADAPA